MAKSRNATEKVKGSKDFSLLRQIDEMEYECYFFFVLSIGEIIRE